jgi:hypothetical protein
LTCHELSSSRLGPSITSWPPLSMKKLTYQSDQYLLNTYNSQLNGSSKMYLLIILEKL